MIGIEDFELTYEVGLLVVFRRREDDCIASSQDIRRPVELERWKTGCNHRLKLRIKIIVSEILTWENMIFERNSHWLAFPDLDDGADVLVACHFHFLGRRGHSVFDGENVLLFELMACLQFTKKIS